MEEVLDLYAEPYDPQRPWVCFDEKPYQLLHDVRPPQPIAPGQAARVDYEYKREGTCNLFLLLDPPARSAPRLAAGDRDGAARRGGLRAPDAVVGR
jgi:hypothetical protein